MSATAELRHARDKISTGSMNCWRMNITRCEIMVRNGILRSRRPVQKAKDTIPGRSWQIIRGLEQCLIVIMYRGNKCERK